MKVALLYTCHRQFEELRFTGAFLRRCDPLLRDADVFLHCNNGEMDPSLLQQALDTLPNPTKCLLHTEENAGYKWGPLQQVSACLPMLSEYDYCIHMHPDVYITDDTKLVQLLKDHHEDGSTAILVPPEDGNTAILVNCLHAAHVLDNDKAKTLSASGEGDVPAYSFDFFILRPKFLGSDIFGAYKDEARIAALAAEGRDFPEMMFHDTILAEGTPHVVFQRHTNPSAGREGARFIDDFGLWHSHNNFQVERFLKREGYTLLSIMGQPRNVAPQSSSNDNMELEKSMVWYSCARCGDGGAGSECARCREYGYLHQEQLSEAPKSSLDSGSHSAVSKKNSKSSTSLSAFVW
eukprot:CAMPEP_0114268244 /NCGR_PEP_ID=MMETSP0058-20121206/25826_1 /TAXON_ID=36894 /ORGANISM="Pyramimonas parkeae, CCMP726" /LENGTH=349 /DNA_ID=CAMNT_0001386351 /DNA_START=101 /DNA_END=1148 /DNA_ORIENTATION=+